MNQFAIDGMAYEVLALVRQERALYGYGDNVSGYDALARIAGPVSCLVFGHPDQPRRRLSRFRERPWRCARCETWWVTEHYTTYGNYDVGGAWHWVPADLPVPSAGEEERRDG